EIGADAIVWAAVHRRRELSVGAPTVAAIWTDKFASGLLDHYLARTGYESQQTTEPADPTRPHNLWDPLPGDHGAHGRFASRSADSSFQTWINERRWPALLGLVGTAAVLVSAALRAPDRNVS